MYISMKTPSQCGANRLWLVTEMSTLLKHWVNSRVIKIEIYFDLLTGTSRSASILISNKEFYLHPLNQYFSSIPYDDQLIHM